MAKTLYIFRHGQVEEKYQNMFLGITDALLSVEGKNQMKKFIPFVARFPRARVFFSPLKRARESYEIAAGELALNATEDNDLREIDFGTWDGMNFLEIQKTYPEIYRDWMQFSIGFTYPGGESHTNLIHRVKRVAQRIIREKTETVLAFTHGGVALFLICELLGLSPAHYRLFFMNRGSRSMIDLSKKPGVLRELNYY